MLRLDAPLREQQLDGVGFPKPTRAHDGKSAAGPIEHLFGLDDADMLYIVCIASAIASSVVTQIIIGAIF